MDTEIFLTTKGAKKIREELNRLIHIERKNIAQRLRAAIQQGDLSENADYIKAKEDQAFLEGKISELEFTLKHLVIIEEKKSRSDIVEIGSTVTLQESNFEPITYMILGSKEADPSHGKISYESPIGKAIMGHKAGDSVIVNTPDGNIEIKIISTK